MAEDDAIPGFMGRGQSPPAFFHGQTNVKADIVPGLVRNTWVGIADLQIITLQFLKL